MIQTNLKKLFENAGLEAVRPTDNALEKMDISRRRFTLLMDNKHVTPISVQELESIKTWVEEIKAIDPDQVIGDYTPHADIAQSLGLNK